MSGERCCVDFSNHFQIRVIPVHFAADLAFEARLSIWFLFQTKPLKIRVLRQGKNCVLNTMIVRDQFSNIWEIHLNYQGFERPLEF